MNIYVLNIITLDLINQIRYKIMKKLTLFFFLCLLSLTTYSQVYVEENFNTTIPATWTITDAGEATGDSWISGNQGFGGNTLDGTNGAIVDSDANGNGTHLIETLTSPIFDSSTAANLILEFDQYFNYLGSSSAIVEVFDGTTWVEVLNQSADVGSFAVPDEQSINITAYANVNMQVRFIYDDGDSWEWYWIIDNFRVSNVSCAEPVDLNITNINATTADLTWLAGGIESMWEVVVQTAGTGIPTVAGTSETSPYNITGLTPDTAYEVYIRSNCGGTDGDSNWAGPINFTTSVVTDFIIDCGVGALNFDYCYNSSEFIVYNFSTNNGFPVTITFDQGEVEGGWDEFYVFDTDGTPLTSANYYGNDGDLTGLTYTSTGDTLSFGVDSDGSFSCDSAGLTQINATVICQTCIKPTVTFTPSGDCAANPDAPEFFIDVEVLDLGSVSFIQIVDDQGGIGQLPTAPGIFTFGPYVAGTNVVMEVSTDDVNCIEYSDPLTVLCPAPPNECSMIFAGPDQTFDCDDNSVDLTASFQVTGQDFNVYEINALTSCPTPPTTGGTPTSLDIDDRWSEVIDLGFEFCFFGGVYNEILIGSNGVATFDTSLAGGFNDWGFTDTLPNNTDNALSQPNIFAGLHDIDPSVCGDVNYTLLGTAPSRQFVINFDEVCQFSCNELKSSMQIIIYESSNNIDINIFDKPTCPGWNGGNAVIGIQNPASDTAFTPPGRNTGVWDATNEFYRFSPGQSATPDYVFEWYDNGIFIGNTETVTVNPIQTTTYTASISYSLCTGGTVTVTDEVTVEFTGVLDDSNFTVTPNCSGATVTVDGQNGGQFAFNPAPGDGAVISPTTGEVTNAVSGETYTIEYSINSADICGSTTTQTFTVLDAIVLAQQNIEFGVCTSDVSGFSVVDLTQFSADFSVGVLNPMVTFYNSQADAESSINSIISPLEYSASLDEIVYVRVESIDSGCFDIATVIIQPGINCTFPQGISPNNDGLNDRFDLTSYNVDSLEIFSRNGAQVYIKNGGYTNQWAGQSKNGDQLPVGTYYFIAKYKNGTAKASWVYISK